MTTMRTGGALALTLASVLFLSGVWCIFLSPVSTINKTKQFFQDRTTLEMQTSPEGLPQPGYHAEFTIRIEEGDTLTIQVHSVSFAGPYLNSSIQVTPGICEKEESPIDIEEGNASESLEPDSTGITAVPYPSVNIENGTVIAPSPVASITIYLKDLSRRQIWSEHKIDHTVFSIQLVSGYYIVELFNPHADINVECFWTYTVTGDVEYRPLQPVGSLLILVSLPIFGYGFWTRLEKKRGEKT